MVETSVHVTGHEPGTPVAGEEGGSILLHTNLGNISCLFRDVPQRESAVLWAGAWHGEGEGLRSSPIARAVAGDLFGDGIASLLLRYRRSGELGACIRDTQAGVAFLEGLGVRRIALVGHSFSGAVVISVAPTSQAIVAVVGLASQTFGAQSAAHIHPRPLLLVHGLEDSRLNAYCSEQIYSWARKPKELVLLEGASHGLWERSDELLPLLTRWLAERLRAGGPGREAVG